MINPKTWSFEEGWIRFISADLGQIVVETTDTRATFTSKAKLYLIGFCMMSHDDRDQVAALLTAFKIAWPDPVPSTDRLSIATNITIDEDGR